MTRYERMQTDNFSRNWGSRYGHTGVRRLTGAEVAEVKGRSKHYGSLRAYAESLGISHDQLKNMTARIQRVPANLLAVWGFAGGQADAMSQQEPATPTPKKKRPSYLAQMRTAREEKMLRGEQSAKEAEKNAKRKIRREK